jgi:hypothetical protein
VEAAIFVSCLVGRTMALFPRVEDAGLSSFADCVKWKASRFCVPRVSGDSVRGCGAGCEAGRGLCGSLDSALLQRNNNVSLNRSVRFEVCNDEADVSFQLVLEGQ